ncbi:hypothetical protein MKO06_05500 [Gramella sp. GC03-9]|uniref:Outer membrane protein beta-barrel domain-containing protein n=1 Tax=Christiangramia oceanisediminis TaxID=2920386 RepID=A0A9X2KXD8_9FLAO|nr:hypothetical protein [Gramella oceanisediminis]MCP9199351.1 hypothetical protein [Gramella oceanisediminis]
MKEKKSIDRIFQEKFKDFEAEPREQVWDQISARLDKKEKKRPFIIPLWLKVGGVAAVLGLVVASILFTNTTDPGQPEPGVVFEEPSELDEEKIDPENNPGNEATSNRIANQETNSEKDSEENSQNSTNSELVTSTTASGKTESGSAGSKEDSSIASVVERSERTKYEKEEEVIQPETTSAVVSGEIADSKSESTQEEKSTKSILETEEENALAQLEESQKDKAAEKELEELNSRKFRLSTFAAPVFYTNLGSGNEISSQFSNNSTSSEVTVSYGVKVAYEISDKIRLRTGISKMNVSQDINDISYSPAAMSTSFDNIRANQDNIQIRNNAESGSSFSSNSADRNSLTNSVFTPGAINQQFGFIEIPLEIEYSIINERFGLNLIGGASSLFLDDNQVNLVSGNSSTNIGEASNINNTSFSTNIGLGMDYKLNSRFSISLEPIFKYQLNTFNNVENVRPANFGIYSGINFKL